MPNLKTMKKKEMGKRTAAESRAEPELYEDLILQILLKLPAKSLLRFKRVSKTWMQMITSNSFISKHYSVAKNRQRGPSFFIIRTPLNDDEVESFVTQISINSSTIRIHENIHLPFLDWCRGRGTYPLMFPAGFGLYCIFELLTQRVALWNPGTRKLKLVPPSPFWDRIHVAYDRMFGFGHVQYKDDEFSYKIGLLSVLHYLESHSLVLVHRLQLYSSSSDSWKVIPTPEGISFRSWLADGVNFKGKYHILSNDLNKEQGDDNGYHYHIMTFDYSNEVFGRMEGPDLPQITGHFNLMYESFLTLDDGVFLCLVIRWSNEQIHDEDFLDVWVMREYGVKESWSKVRTVGPISFNKRMLGYSKSAGGFFLKDCDHGLFLCNWASLAVERLHHVDFGHFSFVEMENMQVLERTVESLVPIKGASDMT